MSHLLRFPVDIIKIDRSFVNAMGDDGQGSDLAEALVTLGRSMGLQTVGEGIEQPHQLGLLASLHCELGQGYLFAKPLAADACSLSSWAEASPSSPSRPTERQPLDTADCDCRIATLLASHT